MTSGSTELSRESAVEETPWTKRADWAAGKIRASQQTLFTLVVFTLFWNAISWTVAIAGWPGFQRHGAWVLGFVALFPFIGVIMALVMIYALLRRQKFGVSVFEMASVPGVIGGPLAGLIQVPRKLRPEFGFKLKLNCIRHYQQGEDNNQDLLWQDEQLLGRELFDELADTTAIPVQFAIPCDARESEKRGSETIQWQLEVQAEDPGIDYHEMFDVPVFRTAASSPDFKLDEGVLAPFIINPTLDDILRAAKLLHEPTAGGEVFVFPPARPLGTAVVLTGILAFWVGGMFLMAKLEFPIFFLVVLGLFGILIGWMCLDLWLRSSRIEIDGQEVHVRNGWLGLGRTQTVPRADVTSIETKQRMRSGTHAWFDAWLVTSKGDELNFGRYIYGPRLAKAVADAVMDAIRGRQN